LLRVKTCWALYFILKQKSCSFQLFIPRSLLEICFVSHLLFVYLILLHWLIYLFILLLSTMSLVVHFSNLCLWFCFTQVTYYWLLPDIVLILPITKSTITRYLLNHILPIHVCFSSTAYGWRFVLLVKQVWLLFSVDSFVFLLVHFQFFSISVISPDFL